MPRIVLVAYYFSEKRLIAFGIRADLQRPETLVVEADPERLRADIREGAADPKQNLRAVLARATLAACVEPIVRWSDPEDLICIVPSGELFSAPFHAMLVDGEPLITRNPVFYAPSASALRYCVRRGRFSAGIARGATVFGNPWWDLAHAEEEAAAVAQLLGVKATVGVDVTRERWFEAMQASDIIHFAGHAAFDSTDPLASALYLAGDQRVTARELFASAVDPLRLIALSGCQTGVNEIHPGDELLGLTRALLYAGASSLLLTLWSIADSSAAELMRVFYESWLHQKAKKVDALRAAQLAVMRRHDDPYHWAPFVLVGDWE